MSDEKQPDILGGLPRTRPHRRSEKRAEAKSSNGHTAGKQPPRKRPSARSQPLRQPKQPGGTPPKPATRRPAPPSGTEIVSTVVQAAAELVEIGLSAGARAVRDALRRLPRP